MGAATVRSVLRRALMPRELEVRGLLLGLLGHLDELVVPQPRPLRRLVRHVVHEGVHVRLPLVLLPERAELFEELRLGEVGRAGQMEGGIDEASDDAYGAPAVLPPRPALAALPRRLAELGRELGREFGREQPKYARLCERRHVGLARGQVL